MKMTMRLPNLCGLGESPGVQRPASCRLTAQFLRLTGSRWNNMRLRGTECAENEPLPAGDSYR